MENIKIVGIYKGKEVPYKKYSNLPATGEEFKRKDEGLSVPTDGNKYVKIKHDWQVLSGGVTRQKEQNLNVKYPVPAIVNKEWGWKVNGDAASYYHPLPKEWQYFMWNFWDWGSNKILPTGKIESFYEKKTNSGLFARTTPGSLTFLYVDMIEKSRAWTDSINVETGAIDYVTNRNLNGRAPYGWLCRPTTGHMLKVIGETYTAYKVSCIDLNMPPPPIEEMDYHPEWVVWATQVHVEKYVSRFPQVKEAFSVHGYPPQGTPVPLIAPGGFAFINKKSVSEMKNGESWSPYL